MPGKEQMSRNAAGFQKSAFEERWICSCTQPLLSISQFIGKKIPVKE
jgi:hypothetical protein